MACSRPFGWLVYGSQRYEKNKWFAHELISKAEVEGIELKLVTDLDAAMNITCDEIPRFAIMRDDIILLSRKLEQANVRVFNSPDVSALCNNKQNTYLEACRLGIPHLPTVFAGTDQQSLKEACLQLPFEFPCVLKGISGHGGNEVFEIDDCLIYDDEQLTLIAQSIGSDGILLQQKCDEPGIDLRVYVMGNQPIAYILRTSETSFKSNYSLGGKASVYEPTESEKMFFRDCIDAFETRFDFVGFDFIRHQGEWVLNEIEDVVGCRMLYHLQQLDAAGAYIRYISKILG